jgi:iron complex transport system permease protein
VTALAGETATAAADSPDAATARAVAAVIRGRRRARRRTALVLACLAVVVAALVGTELSLGATVTAPGDVLRVLLGETVPGASFTVGELRLPRALTGLLAGIGFGMAGTAFQTLLRNPLASPDVIGITAGASTAAVFSIVILHAGSTVTSALAVGAALLVAVAIQLLARGGRRAAPDSASPRLVLIGVGMGAALQALTAYLLLRAASYDVPLAARWLTGSLGDAFWEQLPPLAIAVAVLAPALLLLARRLGMLGMGDELATGLGLRVSRTRLAVIVAATALAAFATAATGPVAFVAFLAGPIARRLLGRGSGALAAGGLVGAALVIGADLVAQHLLGTRYPAGVVTGVLGAPVLLLLLARSTRGGSA